MFMRTFPPNLPRTCPFTNFVWTKMEKKKIKKIMVYIHSRETCETFAVRICEDSLYGGHAPSCDGALVCHQAQLQPRAVCLVYSLPGSRQPHLPCEIHLFPTVPSAVAPS